MSVYLSGASNALSCQSPAPVSEEKHSSRACMICLEEDGDGLQMQEIRCAHNLCMKCFEDLRKRNMTNCPECRRPIMVDNTLQESVYPGDWLLVDQSDSTGDMSSGSSLVVETSVQALFSQICKRREGLSVVGAQEVSRVLDEVFSEVIEQCQDLVNEDSGYIVFGPQERAQQSCVNRICSQETESRLRELLLGAANLAFERLKSRFEMVEGQKKPLLSESQLEEVFQMTKDQIEDFIEFAITKHTCNSTLYEEPLAPNVLPPEFGASMAGLSFL